MVFQAPGWNPIPETFRSCQTQCENLKAKQLTREEKEQYRASHSTDPSAASHGMLWSQIHCMIQTSTYKSIYHQLRAKYERKKENNNKIRLVTEENRNVYPITDKTHKTTIINVTTVVHLKHLKM